MVDEELAPDGVAAREFAQAGELREVESTQTLEEMLRQDEPLAGVRLQDVDLRGEVGQMLLASTQSLQGLVVLGGQMSDDTLCALVRRGAVVFPQVPDAPIDPYRARLYKSDELYAGLAENGYAATPDARAYAWSRETTSAADVYTTALRALHDDAVHDALTEALVGRRAVGIMGGHAMSRDSASYREVAHLGRVLADAGFVVLTGGGPGAMEAANLGAACRNERLDEAVDVLARTPSFRPSIDAWASTGFAARALIGAVSDREKADIGVDGAGDAPIRSIGIPTWFYGHEPPNVFGDGIAKFFSNALREDDLLAGAREAVVVLEGAAGTVQEIFQCATPMFYAAEGAPLPELILVGRRQWTEDIPVWSALQALARGRAMEQHLHLVETTDEAAALLRAA